MFFSSKEMDAYLDEHLHFAHQQENTEFCGEIALLASSSTLLQLTFSFIPTFFLSSYSSPIDK